MNKLKNSAIEKCFDSNASLTPKRLLIFNAILKYKKPVTAYQLQTEIEHNGNKLNISTIYRVIDFWIKLGLIHKIGFLNKFVVCKKPNEINTHIVNVCTKCEKIFETSDQKMGINLNNLPKLIGLSFAKNYHLDIPVKCEQCIN